MRNFTKALRWLVAVWVVLLGICSRTVFAQAPDWKWQNPFPTGNGVGDIFFINPQVGWSVSYPGTIIKTINGGESWQPQTSGTYEQLKSVCFVNPQTGWIVGASGTILHTVNGGATWLAQTSGTTSTLNDVHFETSLKGWICGNDGKLLYTSDGGNTWISQNGISSGHFTAMQFYNDKIGWIAGYYGGVFTTKDGGATWVPHSVAGSLNLESVYFLDSLKGWAVGQDVYKTVNGGITWQNLTHSSLYGYKSVYFENPQNGWVSGTHGSLDNFLKKTTDGGATWQTVLSSDSMEYCPLTFCDSLHGRAGFYKTTDGGQIWQNEYHNELADGDDLNSVFFLDHYKGWAVGKYGSCLRTSDAGLHWEKVAQNVGGNDVFFTDEHTGYIVDYPSYIKKTTDGGESWAYQETGGFYTLTSIYFVGSKHGWAVGAAGRILATHDRGLTWQVKNSNTDLALYSVFFTDSLTGWAAGGYYQTHTIVKTIDGGETWQVQYYGGTPGYNELTSIYFHNSQIGWAVGVQGKIFKTTNGGTTWQPQNSGVTGRLAGVWFKDALRGWIAGDNGNILKTTDGGATWKKETRITYLDLKAICFADAHSGWVVGNSGAILSTVFVDEISPETPSHLVRGKLLKVNSADCIFTPEVPVPGKVVKADPGPYYTMSNSMGEYQLRLTLSDIPATFQVQAIPFASNSFNSTVVCPPNGTHTIAVDTTPDTTAGKDFGYQITPCHHLNVEIASNRRRRCFRNTTTISYLNQGSHTAPDAYVLVEFPHWVRPLFSSIPHLAINDSIWRFNLDTVSVGESGTFTIIDSVVCGHQEILNWTQCTKAIIYPAPDCPANPNWSGAALSTSAICQHPGTVLLMIRNSGSTSMADSSGYRIYLDSILVSDKKVKLVQGDSLMLQVQTGGKTVRLEADQVAFHPTQITVIATVEACGLVNSTTSTGFVNKFPQAHSPISKTHCLPIRDSYDPNDKQAFPIGFTTNHVVRPGTEMEYQVRFQNTGTDTAFTVYVIDSLDNNLNPESLEFGAASHPYEISLQTSKLGRTFLRWQFDHINLPDSNTNELKSHGFFQYRISPKTGIALGTQARNEAAIYFDFNAPVLTNRTLTTFDNLVFTNPGLNDSVHVVVPTATRQSLKQLGLEVYPNPFTHALHLRSASENLLSVSISDLMGKELKTIQFRSSEELPLAELPPGVYYLKFLELHRVMKVVKQ